MPVLRTYLCPECNGRFEVLHMKRDEPPPLECELCKAYLGEEVEAELPNLHIGGSNIARSVDQMWDQMSADKYDKDGNMVAKGLSDMNDNLRQGDIAAKSPPPNNIITQYAQAVKDMSGQDVTWQGADAKGYIDAGKKKLQASTNALGAIQNNFNRFS